MATTAEMQQKAIRGGWMTPNDVRRQNGMVPIAGANELLVSRDLVPLRVVMDEKEL